MTREPFVSPLSLIDLERYIRDGKVDEAKMVLQEEIKWARDVKDMFRMARAQLLMGRALAHGYDIQGSIDAYVMALEAFQEVEDIDGIMASLTALGTVHRERQDLVSAERYLAELTSMTSDSDDDGVRARGDLEYGLLLVEMGDLPKAVALLDGAIERLKRLDDKISMGRAFQGLGLALMRSGESDRAIKSMDLCISLSDDLGDEMGGASAAAAAGECLLEVGDLKRAEAYAKKALEIARTSGEPLCIANALRVLANIKTRLERPAEAENLFKDALNLVEGKGSPTDEMRLRLDIATFLVIAKRGKEARPHIERALKIAEELGSDAMVEKARAILDEKALRPSGKGDA